MDAKGNIRQVRRTALALAIGAMCAAGTVWAVPPGADGQTFRARAQLLNAEIKNRQGEELGEIEELVVDGNGKIQYVVISHGGVLDIGDKVVAVPWQAAHVAVDEDEQVVMDMTRAELVQAPSFDKEQWPDMSSQDWSDEMRSFIDSYAARHERQEPKTGVAFEDIDADKDGHLSSDEAQAEARLSGQFTELDRNGDGNLSQWEFNSYEQPAVTTASGETESPSERARAALSPEEQQRREHIAETSQQQNVTEDAETASVSSAGGGNTGKSADEQPVKLGSGSEQDTLQDRDTRQKVLFGSLDADADGSVSREEAKASETLDARFSEVDRNQDGQIDRAEFSAFESAAPRTEPQGKQGDSGSQSPPAQAAPPR